MYLPPAGLLERTRNGFLRRKRSLDTLANRTILRASHARKKSEWDARIADVLTCPDYAYLPRVPDAGQVTGGVQTMHNGVKVVKDCYYRWRGTFMFTATEGVHEPLEERVFAEVLKFVQPGGVMIELGAYWGFYSLWFANEVANPRCLLIEPELINLDLGRENFRLNARDGEFVRAMVGAESSKHWWRGATVCVDDLVEQRGLEQIDILHSDIQGFEDAMLQGAARTLEAREDGGSG